MNKLKILSIAFCFLVSGFWSEIQCADSFREQETIDDFLTNKSMQKPTVVWIHANNEQTSNVLKNFTENLCRFVDIQEIHSLSSLASYENPFPLRAIVTEMGFWVDNNHTVFGNEAGISAMSLLNKKNLDPNGKFVISARVGRNKDNLLERSKQMGYTHTYPFEPIIDSLSLSMQEKEMYTVINRIQEGLSQKPINHPPGYEKYPVSTFKIEGIYDIRNNKNTINFNLKRDQLKKIGYSEYEWHFHGSQSKESTLSIIKDNFDLKFLGAYSGNFGFYGMGIYFSTRPYLPIYIACAGEIQHFMFLACKTLPGNKNVVECLSKEDYTKGVPIKYPFNSNISSNGLEVVIPDVAQILPCFLIKFSLYSIEDRGFWEWGVANGGKKKIRDIYLEKQPMKSFT